MQPSRMQNKTTKTNLLHKRPILLWILCTALAAASGCGSQAERPLATDAGQLTAAPSDTPHLDDSESNSPSEPIGPQPAGDSAPPEASSASDSEQEPKQEPEQMGPKPNPEASSEENGTLSPPSEDSSGSIFGNGSAQENQIDTKMQGLLTQLQSGLPAGNGTWSVYVWDSGNDSEGTLNNQPMQAASLIKLFIMGAVYENYGTITQQYGQNTVDSNLHSMITVSDNDSANTLVGYLGNGDSASGMQIVNRFCTSHGYTDTSMGRLLLQSNEYGDNYTSVSDCGHFLKEIYRMNTTEYPYAGSMFELLKQQTRRHKLPAQMPEGVHIANKTGELSDVENDAGILYDSPNSSDLVMVFMSENLADTISAQNTIASLGRQIYNYYGN